METENKLEEDLDNTELWKSEKKAYPFLETLVHKDRKYFLEDSLNLLKSNPNFLKEALFKQDSWGLRNDPVIYHKFFKFSKVNLVKSSLQFPLEGEEIPFFIEKYFSGDLVLDQNPIYGWPGQGFPCDFPDTFYIDIKKIGSVKYSSGFLKDSLFFSFGIGKRFMSSLTFEGIGNLELDPHENLEKLKRYYRFEK